MLRIWCNIRWISSSAILNYTMDVGKQRVNEHRWSVFGISEMKEQSWRGEAEVKVSSTGFLNTLLINYFIHSAAQWLPATFKVEYLCLPMAIFINDVWKSMNAPCQHTVTALDYLFHLFMWCTLVMQSAHGSYQTASFPWAYQTWNMSKLLPSLKTGQVHCSNCSFSWLIPWRNTCKENQCSPILRLAS